MAIESIRDRRRRTKNLAGVLLIVIAVSLVIALLVWFERIKENQVELDQMTLCPTEGPRGLTVVLIDRTDPLTVVQRGALRQKLADVKNKLPLHSAIEIYSVGPIGDDLLRAEGQRVCNPGQGKDISEWTGNPRLVKKKWLEGFAAPLNRVIDKMLQPGSSPTSPILESIQSVAVSAFGSLPEVEYRHLVIVSDMLHNTDEFSQYKQVTSFSDFRRTQYYRRVRAELSKIDVEIIYLRRDEGLQGKRHIEFWQEYFTDCGATLVSVEKLQG